MFVLRAVLKLRGWVQKNIVHGLFATGNSNSRNDVNYNVVGIGLGLTQAQSERILGGNGPSPVRRLSLGSASGKGSIHTSNSGHSIMPSLYKES